MSAAPVIRCLGFDDDGRLRDQLGRQHPTRFNLIWAFRAVPGLAEQFNRRVPGSYWSKDREDIAVVACPCGAEPEAALGKITECGCERFYLYAGNEVRVANSPAGTEPLTEEEEAADGELPPTPRPEDS